MNVIERRLEALAYDGMEANFDCVLALAPAPRSAYARVLAQLDASLAGKDSAWLLALKGKTLSNLGRYEQARTALARSLKLGAGRRARTWLGAVELLRGAFASALKESEAVLEEDGAAGWARFYRAAALFALGQEERGREELLRIDAPPQAKLAGQVFLLLLRARSGAHGEALPLMAPVLRARPRAGWPYALRARLHQGLGDKAACLRDLARALKLGPAAWILLERSKVYEELGDIDRALADVDAAKVLAGPSAELSLRRAHLQVCRRHYHLAIPDYTEALRLDPAAYDTLLARAGVHCIRERLDLALSDVKLAERLSGGEPRVRLERLRMSVYAGRTKGVARELSALAASAPDLKEPAGFLAGCLGLKTGAYASADAAFTRALSPEGGTDHDRKVTFYRTIARGLTGLKVPARAKDAAPRLLICGLGIKPPYTADLETLRAIRSCDFIFNNLSEPEIAGMLRLLADECEPTMFDIRGADSRWTKTIFRQVRAGRTVGFVTRGHPLVCGGLACSLMEECGKRGVEFKVYGSVSSMDTVAIETFQARGGWHWGSQVLDYSSVFSEHFSLDPRVPAVLYFNATAIYLSKAEHARFCDNLEKVYGAEHPCYYYGRSFHVSPDLIALSELRAQHGRIDPSFTLLLPPKGARR